MPEDDVNLYSYCVIVNVCLFQVLQGRELPAKDFSGTSDPYIKIYLLPDRKKKFQTRVSSYFLDNIKILTAKVIDYLVIFT